jgi:DNA mismatch repair protein MutS
MSGKSTYMRQVALIQLMAQAGSFVPASSAALSLVDRVFTRVGASDDIAGGKSTFMVEMTELADILEHATDRSLVLLDEVGRGTSTTDGLAIARAVTEYLHDEVGARTLFATHHHELTATAEALPGASNWHFAASEQPSPADAGDATVTFDHEIRRGPADASYGVEVAREAGVPDAVVDRSRELLDAGADTGKPTASPERGRRTNGHEPADAHEVADEAGTATQTPRDIESTLREQSLAETTPLEALQLLSELKDRLDD